MQRQEEKKPSLADFTSDELIKYIGTDSVKAHALWRNDKFNTLLKASEWAVIAKEIPALATTIASDSQLSFKWINSLEFAKINSTVCLSVLRNSPYFYTLGLISILEHYPNNPEIQTVINENALFTEKITAYRKLTNPTFLNKPTIDELNQLLQTTSLSTVEIFNFASEHEQIALLIWNTPELLSTLNKFDWVTLILKFPALAETVANSELTQHIHYVAKLAKVNKKTFEILIKNSAIALCTGFELDELMNFYKDAELNQLIETNQQCKSKLEKYRLNINALKENLNIDVLVAFILENNLKGLDIIKQFDKADESVFIALWENTEIRAHLNEWEWAALASSRNALAQRITNSNHYESWDEYNITTLAKSNMESCIAILKKENTTMKVSNQDLLNFTSAFELPLLVYILSSDELTNRLCEAVKNQLIVNNIQFTPLELNKYFILGNYFLSLDKKPKAIICFEKALLLSNSQVNTNNPILIQIKESILDKLYDLTKNQKYMTLERIRAEAEAEAKAIRESQDDFEKKDTIFLLSLFKKLYEADKTHTITFFASDFNMKPTSLTEVKAHITRNPLDRVASCMCIAEQIISVMRKGENAIILPPSAKTVLESSPGIQALIKNDFPEFYEVAVKQRILQINNSAVLKRTSSLSKSG